MKNFKITYKDCILGNVVAFLLICILHLSSILGFLPSLLSQQVGQGNVSTLDIETLTVSTVLSNNFITAETSFDKDLLKATQDNCNHNSPSLSYLFGEEKLEKEKEMHLLFTIQSGSNFLSRASFSHVENFEKSALIDFILSHLRTVVLLN